jgi:hypothetical protein
MSREELVSSVEYWTANYQITLFNEINNWSNGRKDKECAELLGISLFKYKQIKNGDWKGSIKEYTSILLKIGKVSTITIKNIDNVI